MSDPDPPAVEGNETPSGGVLDSDGTTRDRLLQASLVVLGVLAVIALGQLYASVGAVIRIWVAPRYQPLLRATFNLAVFLVAAIGISITLRRLRTPG